MIVGSGFLIQLLEASAYRWLAPLAPFVPLATYNLNEFCAVDPPAQPTFTPEEANALLQLEFGTAFDTGLGKLGDLVQNRLWWAFCQCDTMATPAPPTPQPQPDGVPSYVLIYGGECGHAGPWSDTIAPTPATFRLQQRWPFTSFLNNAGTGSFSGTPLQVQFHCFVAPGDTVHATYTFRVQITQDTGGAIVLNTRDVVVPSGGHVYAVLDSPVNAAAVQIFTSYDTAGTHDNPNTDARLFCAVDTSHTPTTCCAPDTQLVETLQAIRATVELIQRQAVPFAYIHAATHTDLTGQGHVDVEGLIGVLVNVTALPSAIGLEGGEPDVLFEVGWINWGNDDGSTPRERIQAAAQVSFPVAAGQFTRISYSLAPGVHVDLVELVREP